MPGSVHCSFSPQLVYQPEPIAAFHKNTISICHVKMENVVTSYNNCHALLSQNERVAGAKYRRETDQQRYVLQHGILRMLLSRYLNIDNSEIIFNHNQNKKPYLANKIGGGCYFNLSHSGGDFLIAIGDKELGVDIEQIKPEFQYQDIASQYFSAGEVEFIDKATDPTEAFFLLWTRKEALLKACGTGIDDNLPLMPALGGRHLLPVTYPNQDWLTESFRINYHMTSITYRSPQTVIQLFNIDEAWLADRF